MIPIRISNNCSTMVGVCSTRAESTLSIKTNSPSTTAGVAVTNASTAARTNTVNALAIAGPPFAITPARERIPSPIASNSNGIRLRILDTATTRDAAPAAPDTAKAESPVENARIPAPAARHPTPNTAIAAESPRIAGVSGPNTTPATPSTVKEPASATKPLAMLSQDIFPNVLITGVNTASAADTVRTAAAPGSAPLIALSATTRMVMEPARVTKPLAISSQDIPPIFRTASPMMSNAAPTSTIPVAFDIIPFGRRCIATVTAAKEPAIVVRPRPISPQDKFPIFSTASPNTSMAAPRIVIAVAVETTCFALAVTLVNTANSVRTTATADNPFKRLEISKVPNAPTASVRMLMDAARRTKPVPFRIPIPSKSVAFRNNASSVQRTPTPIRPFAKDPTSNAPKSSTAPTSTRIAAANTTKPAEPFINPFDVLESAVADATRIADNPATPTNPFRSPSQSKPDNFCTAPARIRTAVDIPIIAIVNCPIPLIATPFIIFSKIAIEPSNSTNRTLKAPKEAFSFPESTSDNATIAAVKIAIAPAILRRVPAFRLDCHASKLPFTPSKISLNEPSIPPPFSVISDKELINFFTPIRIAENNPVLIKSKIGSKLAVSNAVRIASPRFPNAFATIEPSFDKTGDAFSTIPIIPSNAFFTNSPNFTNGSNRVCTLSAKLSSPLVSTFANSPKASVIVFINVFTPSAIGFKKFPIPSMALLNASDDLIASSMPTMKSPIPAVKPRIPSPAGAT